MKKNQEKIRYVYGVGINNADYMVHPRINGKSMMCPFYQTWHEMMRRCYSPKFHEYRPNYTDCTVHKDWIFFRAFREWMEKQDWEGRVLDKDLLIPGNTKYGPDSCIFITKELNTLLNDCGKSRGQWPQGVSFDKSKGRFRARIKKYGKEEWIGYFNTPEKAEQAYIREKITHCQTYAAKQTDQDAASGLFRHIKVFQDRLKLMVEEG